MHQQNKNEYIYKEGKQENQLPCSKKIFINYTESYLQSSGFRFALLFDTNNEI